MIENPEASSDSTPPIEGDGTTNNVVVISDTHCGCRLALCPPDGIRLDDGGFYYPSSLQVKIYKFWETFWNEFVPDATRGEPYDVIMNGDCIDGTHHHATTQISHNITDQKRIAYELLQPIAEKAENYYHIRGTEAHVGKSAREEEDLAERLEAVPNEYGQFARYDLWKTIGPDRLIHALHHVGTTSSQAYEATAVHKEMIESFVEAARWGREIPDVIVRSHRHRYMMTDIAVQKHGKTAHAISVVTGCWQGKTPFVWKLAGARLSTPQFGGIVIRWAHDELFIRRCIFTVDRSKTV